MKKHGIFRSILALTVCLTAIFSLAVPASASEDTGFAVTFAGDEGVDSITVYETQDTTGASVTVGRDGAAFSRNSDTGEPDSSGSGQINFTVVLAEGYALGDITATSGTYKNIKGPSDTGLANTYRITKISADTTVTITTVACAHSAIADGTPTAWTWSTDFGYAKFSYTCAECSEIVEAFGAVSSVLTDASTVTFTATARIGDTDYTDTKTAEPFTAEFSCDEGVASIYVYYTQDYSQADETDASSAVARDSALGCPVITGDGQINFAVFLNEGYEIESVSATADTYKNIKGPDDTNAPNTYRITKIEDSLTVTVTTVLASASVTDVDLADFDGDGSVTSDDAIQLLRFTLFPEKYPISLDGDLNGDGNVTSDDAVYLLRYTLFPDNYPLT